MSRWAPDARDRLKRAAIDLFVEQGFAATTVPQITARAGLTTRTFFRHFSDKREVLFDGAEMVGATAVLIAGAPAGLEKVALIAYGLRSVAESRFDGRREELRALRRIVESDDALMERELRKRADLAGAIRKGLELRGQDSLSAALMAEATVTVLFVAVEGWLNEDIDRGLSAIALEALAAFGEMLTPGNRPRVSDRPGR